MKTFDFLKEIAIAGSMGYIMLLHSKFAASATSGGNVFVVGLVSALIIGFIANRSEVICMLYYDLPEKAGDWLKARRKK